ncbi:MAG: helix-turn-helix domain-containing protein [Desulfobulbaceae bacterium]|jgi:hypothetical protein|nr:helix-turn-helix domain-containing protein [Desulfobulbaceae bacterium]
MTADFTLDEMRQLLQEEMMRILKISLNGEELYPRKEAAKILKVKENTLAVWAMTGRGPAPTKIGTRSMYRRSVLDQFIKDNTMPR